MSVLFDWSVPVEEKLHMMSEGTHEPVTEFNDFVNSFIFSEAFTASAQELLGVRLAHFALTYLRDILGGCLIYYGVAGIWHYVIYVVMGEKLFAGRPRPTWAVIWDQIKLAQASIFIYAMLPVLAEWFVENKWTACYFYVEEVGGWGMYALYTAIYMIIVELGVYWMHRELHEIKFLYKYVHALHHKYNRADTLSPWASIAFNPLDGVAQASPYVIALFIVPCHYLTHVFLLFFTGVWATNIHDAVPAKSEPIMGANYHTIHHTHYHYNFGQFTIVCDWLFGTLRADVSKPVKAKKAS